MTEWVREWLSELLTDKLLELLEWLFATKNLMRFNRRLEISKPYKQKWRYHFRMFCFDRKQKSVREQNVDQSFIEKVLVVIKARVDNSQRENSESVEEERSLRILRVFSSDLDKKILEINENVKSLTSQFSLKIWFCCCFVRLTFSVYWKKIVAAKCWLV